VNVLKSHLRTTVVTLLLCGTSQREISRRTGVDRKTIRRYAEAAKSPTPATGSGVDPDQIPPPRPLALEAIPEPGTTVSACEPHRSWIEKQVQQGRNAMSVYQDLVEKYAFAHGYNSVKRFVGKLRARDPERFDVLEFLPGEESQVDLGQGAPTLVRPGRYRRPHLFVMTLKYSGKSFRKTAWKMDQETWCRLHEQAWRSFGGVSQYEVIDYVAGHIIRVMFPLPLCGSGAFTSLRFPYLPR